MKLHNAGASIFVPDGVAVFRSKVSLLGVYQANDGCQIVPNAVVDLSEQIGLDLCILQRLGIELRLVEPNG